WMDGHGHRAPAHPTGYLTQNTKKACGMVGGGADFLHSRPPREGVNHPGPRFNPPTPTETSRKLAYRTSFQSPDDRRPKIKPVRRR
ncbi:MAG: hypothetical protein H7839_21305, partial [Magnetococcus sp. YQC-5]